MRPNQRGYRFRTAYLLSSFCVAFLLQGCSTDTETVKDGFIGTSETRSVGDAFDSYRYFRNTTWEEGTNDGARVVVFTGNIDVKRTVADYVEQKKRDPKYAGLIEVLGTAKEAYVKVTFTVSEDDSFQLVDKETFLAITLTAHGGKERRGALRPASLRAIYEDANVFIPQYQL